MPDFKIIEVVARKKVYALDSNGNKVKDKDGKSVFTTEEVGRTKCRQYEESKAGLESMKKDLTVVGIVKLGNRQIKTDARNGEARPETLQTAVKKAAELSPENAKRFADLLDDIKEGK